MDGTRDNIEDPLRILLRYALWAIGEYRGETSAMVAEVFEEHLDELDELGAADYERSIEAHVDTTNDELIQALGDDLAFRAENHSWDCRRWAAYLHLTERALWKILCRYAPTSVVREVAAWSDDDRRCFLLGGFPLSLPHGLVANVRNFVSEPSQKARATDEATRKKIGRLLLRLRRVWPEGG
jgi:hypothetical protein